MKLTNLFVIASFVILVQNSLAANELTPGQTIAVKAKACSYMVKFAKSEGVQGYDLQTCLRTAELQYAETHWHTKKLVISYYENSIPDLMNSDQWLSCEFQADSATSDFKSEDSYCSIEG
ncbi:hypothetical protein [Bdellovibrio sp. HCB337]|uniref:hypothetical protein n=1 Tax=Bdellovibrio sp. HCB337 TaxID=3394358 RepID=UPI0039A75FAB